jgi:hypothetical protein
MRKFVGVAMAAGLVLSVGVLGAPTAGAAGGTVCATSKGAAKFTPALPKVGDPKTVVSKLTASGTVGGCAGGGVTSGKTVFTQTVKGTPGNCATLLKPDPKSKGTIGKLVITWNNGSTSTVASFTVKQTKAVTTSTTTGKITAGLFVGSSVSGSVTYTPQAGGCTKVPLATVTYLGAKGTKFIIK